MSELLDKQVSAQKESFMGSRKLPQAHERVYDENERSRQKNNTGLKFFNEKKEVCTEKFCRGYEVWLAILNITRYYLSSKRVNGCQGIVFQVWVNECGAL